MPYLSHTTLTCQQSTVSNKLNSLTGSYITLMNTISVDIATMLANFLHALLMQVEVDIQ